MTDTDPNSGRDAAPDAPAPPPAPYAGSPWSAASPPVPPVPPVSPPPSRRRRGGVALGLFLIVLGALFLAMQFIPGLAWWSLWPLLIVAGGLIQMVTPEDDEPWNVSRIFDGIGTVLFGLVLLGNTTGYISWGVWWVLLTLWPVLLIALGLSILGKGLRQSWLRTLAPVVVWLALGYAVAVSLTGPGALPPISTQVQSAGQPFAFSEPLLGTSQAKLQLKAGAGDIAIKGGSDLVSATGRAPQGVPQLTVNRGADSADVAFTLNGGNGISPTGIGAAQVELALAETPVWDIALETGASSLDADLSSINVRRIGLSTGVGSATLKLGKASDDSAGSTALVKAGVASVTILVPKGEPVVIDTHNGLTATSFGSEFTRQSGGVWQTPGYSAGGKAWHITTETGVSSVSVRTY